MNIIFICHGNICRSPIAEILFNELVKKNHQEENFNVISRATSLEEIGNDIYPPMKRVLDSHNVSYKRHYATRITQQEFEIADVIYYMDRNNLYYLNHLFGSSNKFHSISEDVDKLDIEDPWYTGRYEYVYSRIKECVNAIYKKMTD